MAITKISRGTMKSSQRRNSKGIYEFQEEFFKSQLHGRQTDCDLKCNGGVIQVHSVLLEAVSPFFKKCFESQGENYGPIRTIILQDFDLGDMKNFIQLIYSGSILGTQEEIDEVTKLLQIFEFEDQENINSKKATKEKDEKEIRCTKSSGIYPTVVLEKITLSLNNSNDKQKSSSNSSSTPSTKMLSTEIASRASKRKRNRNSKESTGKRNYKDSDWEPDTTDQSDTEEPISTKAAISPKKTKTEVSEEGTKKNDNDKKTRQKTVKDKDNSLKDDGKGGWEEPDYTDMTWFQKEARKCQHCDKEYEHPAQASMCITGHTSLRCYFCFKVCKNTENLFAHFKKFHKQAGREAFLLCPFCDQTVPYKSVSCHVISVHLNTDKEKKGSTNDIGKTKSGRKLSSAAAILYRPRLGRPPNAGITVSKTKPNKPHVNKDEYQSHYQYHPVVILPKVIIDKNKTKKANEDNSSSISSGQQPANQKHDNDDNDKPSKTRDHHYLIDKEGMIRLGNLDMTIRKKGIDGRKWIWRIQKACPNKQITNDIKVENHVNAE